MFSVLIIDWGTQRTGLAFADPLSGLVIPALGECYTLSLFERIESEVLQRKIEQIIVGLPSNFHGGDTIITKYILNFVAKLKQKYPNLIIKTINERGSSKLAKKQLNNLGNSHSINHLSAVEIANRWLENSK